MTTSSRPEPLQRALSDFIFEARDRAEFWENPAARRLFPQGRGLFALFTGTPGTGKTMAAQVVAAALGLDLFRISLAAVVSKYVGETAKNLNRILARAEAMDAVLLFDEADALFGKRTEIKDAHDRFANTDTNYLLQAIEAYRGIAILATNRKANIDPGFTRRLRYVLEFARPDAAHRQRLWERLLGELAGLERLRSLASLVQGLAAAVDVSGGQIKFAVLAALFAARRDGAPLAAQHLLYGLERELAKEGRALTERERERLGGDARERPRQDIQDLVLRVPGLDRFEARRLAEQVADCLAGELARRPSPARARLDQLHLRVAAGSAPQELARLIARRIREELR